VAEVNCLPRTVPLLLMVAGVVVALRQVARPEPLMLVLPGSEVDHVPSVSAMSGQLPLTVELVENWTWLPGGAARWSEMALAGTTLAVMRQLLVLDPPQPVPATLKKIATRTRTELFMRTRLALPN
jgi:hypothetical protein